jgi:hypothetical protein
LPKPASPTAAAAVHLRGKNGNDCCRLEAGNNPDGKILTAQVENEKMERPQRMEGSYPGEK